MALTGYDIGRYFQQKIAESYTGYIDNSKMNRLFKDALISILEKKYQADDTIKVKDEATFLTRTNVAFAVNNNQVYTAPLQIASISVVGTTGTFTTFLPHNLIDGDKVNISGVAGLVPAPSGIYTITKVSAYIFTATVAATGATIHTANTGVFTSTNTSSVRNMVNDYWHVLNVKPVYYDREYNVAISGISNTSPIVVTMAYYNTYRTGEQVNISGALVNTAANGSWYIKKLNNFKFALYYDINLQTPVAGNGVYTSGAVLSRITSRVATPYESNVKVGTLNIPTTFEPGYEIADNLLKFYPLTITCQSVTLDYIKVPDKVVDVADTITDLTLYYPEKLLYLIIDQAIILFGIQASDNELFKEGAISVQTNP